MSIAFNQLSHRYGDIQVLEDVTLSVAAGKILCVLGPSGSGKSTLLRLAAGLEPVQSGEVLIDGQLVADKSINPAPETMGTGLVFQDHVLFPHLTVAANVEFGLQHLPAEEKRNTAHEFLTKMGVDELKHRYPDTLSGGQQQRVALARALAVQPSVMLMDEPFASVDIALRRALREDARSTLKSGGVATVLVTHDPAEAMIMGDQIACLVAGRIVQVDTPENLWRGPAHPFVAQTVAEAQVIAGACRGALIDTAFGVIELEEEIEPGSKLVCVHPGGASIRSGEAAIVEDIRFLHGEHVILVAAGEARLQIHCAESPEVDIGNRVGLGFTPRLLSVYSLNDNHSHLDVKDVK